MPTTKQTSTYSQTALAAYASGLASSTDNSNRYAAINVGMSTFQAQAFNSTWAVLQQSSPTAEGFSAVLFQNRTTNEKVLAIAGTDPSSGADLIADFIDIGVLGVVSNMPQYISLNSFYSQLIRTGKLGPSEQVVVTGHSLGGFLAQAFTANHSNLVSAAYTFNAPGFAGVNSLLGFLNVVDTSASNKVFNAYAVDGLSFTASYGARLGSSIPVQIEKGTVNPLSNHSVVRLGDSLAVQSMLAALDPNATTGAINALVTVASNQMDNTLEALTDVIRRMTKIGVSPTPTGNRDALYLNLKSLSENGAFKAIASKVSLSTSSIDLATTARTDFVSLLSLLTLSPVTLSSRAGNQTDVEAALQPIWNTAHAAWNADKAVTQADRDAGKTNYTQRFLDDRAAMLGALVLRNQLDTVDGVSTGTGATPVQFVDRQQSVTVHIGLSNPLTDKRQVVFGKDAGDVFSGKSLADRLYGGALNDSLSGMEGADYLEGNAGNDTLDGGAGVFDDTLNGGAGADLYVVSAKAGFDTIATSEAGDRLQLGGRVLNGSGTIIPGSTGMTVWQDGSISTAPITYSFNTISATLTIQGAGSVVLIKDFSSGDLGITVPAASPAPSPPAANPIRDLSTYASYGWRDDGFASTPAGSADRIVNFNGWHKTPEAGLLTIDSRGGNDWIEGGSGVSGMALQVNAGSGNDQVYATALQTLPAALTTQDAAVASGRSDLLLDGGVGDDSVFGGAGDDALFGGNGADTLVGGAGRDVIFSDGDSGSRFSSPAAGFKWVAGDNASGSTLYFNGAPQLGTVSYNYIAGTPNAADRHFEGDFYGVESTDLTPLSALTATALTTSDYLTGWTKRSDGRFSGAASQVGAPDPQAALYFNTNRHSGRDVVYAGSGNDLVNAGGGDDFVDAGTGNDVVRGYQGDDQIHGGAGDDNLLGDSYAKVSLVDEKLLGVAYRKFSLDPSIAGQAHGNDYIDGGVGNDRLEGNGGSDVLFGGSGNDRVYGDDSKTSSGVFIKDEFGGNDYIDTGANEDYAEGGARHDRVLGGDGNDTLFGDNNFQDNSPGAGRTTAAGDDTVEGGLGNDFIWGEGGSDSILGGEGDDQIFGDGDANKLKSELHGNDELDGGWGYDSMLGGGGADTLRGGEGNDWLTGDDEESIYAPSVLAGDDLLVGGNGSDTLIGGKGSDNLSGGAEYDWLSGGSGNDLLDGGAAGDFMMGGDGADTYLFGRGLGVDTIYNDDVDLQGTSADTILFLAGVMPGNILLQSSTGKTTAGHLVIGLADALDTLVVTDYFRSGGSSTSAVEFLRFSDGTTWSVADVKARLLPQAASGATRAGTEGNNSLTGGTGGDRLFGFGGSDVINAMEGGDYLVGGPGADTLIGGTGDDIYRFDLGDGFDRIQESTGISDELRFGPGISASDLTVLRSGNDVILRLLNGTDQITLNSWLYATTDSNKVDRIQFSDGTSWSTADIASRALGLTGTTGNDLITSTTVYAEAIRGLAGNDTLSAWGAGDTLDGGAGDDLLKAANSSSERLSVTFIGGTGSDTMDGSYEGDVYLFDLGDGIDSINESGNSPSNTDELRFGSGIASTDMTVSRVGNDLILKHRNGTDRMTISGWFDFSGWTRQVENFKFRDTTWTAAQLTAPLLTITGTSGADSLIGGDGYAETLRGLAETTP